MGDFGLVAEGPRDTGASYIHIALAKPQKGSGTRPSCASPKEIKIDNSKYFQNIDIPSCAQGGPLASLKYRSIWGADATAAIPVKREGEVLHVRTEELLPLMQGDTKGELTIKEGETERKITIDRAGFIPDEMKTLDPLYRQIAKDINQNGYFVMVEPVVLWDAEFTGEGYLKDGSKSYWADGTSPKTNLYWQFATGLITQLELNNWQKIFVQNATEAPIQTAVLKKTVQASQQWKKLGVTLPFDVYFVAQAYASRDILQGYADYGRLIRGASGKEIALPGGPTLNLDQARVVGATVHFIDEGSRVVGNDNSPKEPKGVFMVSCFGATESGPLMVRPNLFPLMFSLPTTTGEGYISTPVVESVLEVQNYRGILSAVGRSYDKFHHVWPGSRQYTNPGVETFESRLTKGIIDWDNDGLYNEADPEPLFPNRNWIETTTGKTIFQWKNGDTQQIDWLKP